MTAIINTYSHIKFTCLWKNREEVRRAIRQIIDRSSLGMRTPDTEEALDLKRIYVKAPQPGGKHPHHLVAFTPAARPDATVVFTNYQDGWYTLSVAISRVLECRVYRFALSSESTQWPQYFLHILDTAKDIRRVSLLHDYDRWDFYEQGEPLPDEDTLMYRKRRKRDRMTREYMIDLATRLGFPIGDDRFWQTDQPAVYFEERRPSETE